MTVNSNHKCRGCIYNMPKSRGGFGQTCSGITMKKFSRCPEWRIDEIRSGRNLQRMLPISNS